MSTQLGRLASSGCGGCCTLSSFPPPQRGLLQWRRKKGEAISWGTTASSPSNNPGHRWRAATDFSITAMVAGATVGAVLHLWYPPVLPPLLVPIHPPSDVLMCGSLRHFCVLSRGSFVALQLSDL